jgi:hypothetical protein
MTVAGRTSAALAVGWLGLRPRRIAVLAALSMTGVACGETTGLALSAGGPVTGVVTGTITDCGTPASGVEVVLAIQQAAVGQARIVHTQVGPHTTDARGQYLFDISPGFGVPGAAMVQLQEVSDSADARDLANGVVELTLGQEARDTLRLDADRERAREACP